MTEFATALLLLSLKHRESERRHKFEFKLPAILVYEMLTYFNTRWTENFQIEAKISTGTQRIMYF